MKLEHLKVFVIGLGQIGGSIARVLTENRLVSDVIGFDIDKAVTELAGERRYIDKQADSISDGINHADLIIIATPIRTTIKLIPEIIKQAGSDQVILDVAGIQSGILETVSKNNNQTNYISGHPIAGNEGTGLDSASADKFKNTIFFLSPAESAKKESVYITIELIKTLDAIPVIIDPEKHDFLISLTINLPYLLALTLMNIAVKQENSFEDIWKLAGGSFKGATRVASSSPELTLDMFMSNSGNILDTIEIFQSELSELAKLIKNNDEVALHSRIIQAKTHKEHMNKVQDG